MRVKLFSDGDMEDLADFCDNNYISYEILYHEQTNGIVAYLDSNDLDEEVMQELEYMIMSKGEFIDIV